MTSSSEHALWPKEGKIGLCKSGEFEGRHLLLVADTVPGTWYGYVEERDAEDVGKDFLARDQELDGLLRLWEVEWLSPGDDVDVEPELFGLRDHWRREHGRRRDRVRTAVCRCLPGRHDIGEGVP